MSWTSPVTVPVTMVPCAVPTRPLRASPYSMDRAAEAAGFVLPGAHGLHDLRQDHRPAAEEVADDLHPLHRRPLGHLERPVEALPRLLRVLLDEGVDAVAERVREPLLDRALPPRQILLGPHSLAC